MRFFPNRSGFILRKIHSQYGNRRLKNTIAVVINMKYDIMCINDESPHLIDTKIYLLHVERHVRGIVSELVVR